MANQAVSSPCAIRDRSSHNIGHRPVVLDKIKVYRGEIGELMQEIANHRDGLQKHLRKCHRGSNVQIDAPTVKFPHE